VQISMASKVPSPCPPNGIRTCIVLRDGYALPQSGTGLTIWNTWSQLRRISAASTRSSS